MLDRLKRQFKGEMLRASYDLKEVSGIMNKYSKLGLDGYSLSEILKDCYYSSEQIKQYLELIA